MQVAPFRKLRKQKSDAGKAKLRDYVKYDMRQMHVAFTGTVPLTSDEEGDLVSTPKPYCPPLMSHIIELC